MGMHTTKVAVGEGKFALEAQLTVTPRGMAVYACSPEYAHLGATAQAIPRPEPGRTATVSILAVPCHRDEIPAHDIAAALATRFDVPVVASTGFHVEQASGDDLQRVLDTTKELIAALEEAAARRINEELGITREPDQLEHLGHVVYREDHGDGRCECEWCEVYLAHVEPGELHINQEEISEVRRVAPSELDGYLQGHPEQLAPWLREALSDPSIRTALAM